MPAETDEKVHYPTLYFSGNEKMDIPDEGTAVITFRKVDSGENTRDPDEPMYRCEIEVQSLEVKDGPKKGMVSMADAFKKGLDKSMKKKMEYPEGEE
jgi:hypothetical protein